MGAFAVSFADRQRELDSFTRRTLIASLTNRSSYFGYELYEFDSGVRRGGNFDTVSFFVRTLVGFPDHSNLLL